MSVAEADYSPDALPYQEAKRNLLAAQQEAAEASVAKAEAKARIR
jgi:hypothetical protein